MNESIINQLEQLAQPIAAFLHENFHPHMSVIITEDGVKLEETRAFAPIKTGQP